MPPSSFDSARAAPSVCLRLTSSPVSSLPKHVPSYLIDAARSGVDSSVSSSARRARARSSQEQAPSAVAEAAAARL